MYRSLQACRAIAGILVMLFHLGAAFGAEKYFGTKTLATVFSFGHHSVVFFFVLSGFIIVLTHRSDVDKPNRLAQYARKRMTRIYPTYWIVFLLVYCFAVASSTFANSVPHDPLLIVKSLLLLPQDLEIVGGTGAPVLIVAWSLQYEMMFYAVVACFIFNKKVGLMVVGLLALNYFSCKLSSNCTFPRSFLASNYIISFVFGAMTALLVKTSFRFREPLRMVALAVAVLALLRGLDLVFHIKTILEEGVLMYGLVSALLILGLVHAEEAGKLRVGKYWGTLAAASYTLYLIHYPLISLLCKIAVVIGVQGEALIFVAFIVIACLCIASAVVFYRYIERPMLRVLSGSNKAATDGPLVSSSR